MYQDHCELLTGGGLLVPPEVGRPVAAFAVAKVFAEGFGAPVVAALSISKPASCNISQ